MKWEGESLIYDVTYLMLYGPENLFNLLKELQEILKDAFKNII